MYATNPVLFKGQSYIKFFWDSFINCGALNTNTVHFPSILALYAVGHIRLWIWNLLYDDVIVQVYTNIPFEKYTSKYKFISLSKGDLDFKAILNNQL